MHIPIASVADLGLVIRAVRQSSHVRLDDLAATVSLSKQFAQDVEYGKPTVQLGLVLRLLEELGIPLVLDIPESACGKLHELKRKGLRPLKSRKGA
jgi:transcriptional regulator with XRE-family HTH domain